MKKVILVAAVALFTMSTAFATGKKPTTEKKEKSVSEQVAQLLEEPAFKVTEDITATVTLMVNKDNEVVVIDVETQEEFVSNFIKSRLNYEILETQRIGSQFTVPVRIVPGA